MDDFEYANKLNYLGQVYGAHVCEIMSPSLSLSDNHLQQATLRMRDAGVRNGKIVFVSSMAGLISFAGYSTYSPTKFALRGLADSLRNELKMYGIDVHIFLPGNIDSPGYVNEVSQHACKATIHPLTIPFQEQDQARSDQSD